MREDKLNVKILSINISKLFGYKEINIDISPDDNLVVLYGDNGSGKTTVLNLLYHIFSPEPKGGHRTNIGNIIFKSISINLSNKINLILERDEINSGPYHLKITDIDNVINWDWFPNDHPKYKEGDDNYKKYCDLMEKLNFSIFYLPANRHTDEEDDIQKTIVIQDSDGKKRRILRQGIKTSLNRVLRQFQQWLRREMIKRTSVGYRNINDLYNEIIRGIIQDKKSTDNLFSKEIFLDRISEMETRNNGYKKYGLSEDFLQDDIVKILKNTGDTEFNQIVHVLNPYLESINLRLDSLEGLQLLLSKLEGNINNLFMEKKITVSVEDGILIKANNNIKLDYQNLSSGEKQLLSIFCNVITSWGNSHIIIIDEPEISLNIKWQRVFINLILDIIDKKNTQLFIATHSIEMLCKCENNIHQLG